MKSNSSVCLPGASASGAFPAHALEVDQVPEEDRLALQQVEAVAGEAAALGDEHALAAALRDLDLGLEVVGGVEELGASPLGVPVSGAVQVNTLRPAVMLGRGVMRRVATVASSGSTWYFFASFQKSVLQLLQLLRVLRRDVLRLRPVVARGRRAPTGTSAGSAPTPPLMSHGGRMTLVLAIQPSW